MTATLRYETVTGGWDSVQITDRYNTKPNGVLAAQKADGGQILLSPVQSWVLEDDSVGGIV